jgi:hypothetical protein
MESKTIIYSFLICFLAIIPFVLSSLLEFNPLLIIIIETFSVFLCFFFLTKINKDSFFNNSISFCFFYLAFKFLFLSYQFLDIQKILFYSIFGFFFIQLTIRGLKTRDGISYSLWFLIGLAFNLIIYLLSSFL